VSVQEMAMRSCLQVGGCFVGPCPASPSWSGFPRVQHQLWPPDSSVVPSSSSVDAHARWLLWLAE
jgi:hypothetical protein